jgi:hypothetical protein
VHRLSGSRQNWRASVGNSISELLKTKTRTAQRLSAFFAPFWETIGREVGIFDGTGIPPKPYEISHKKSTVTLKYSVTRVLRGSSFTEQRNLVVQLPVDVLDQGETAVALYLQRAYPLQCLLCGLHHPKTWSSCGGLRCVDSLAWRPGVPKPRYYVDSDGHFGYVLPTRGLRFAYNLEENRLLRMEVVGRYSGKWMVPSSGYLERELRYFREVILPQIPSAILGHHVGSAIPSRLVYELPDWCQASM